MATKRERTSFNVSGNLKTALNAAGRTPAFASGQSYYDGAANDVHLLHEQFDDGAFRTTNVAAGAISFDFIVPGDAALVRIWTERELQVLIGNLPGVQGSSGVQNGTAWTWTILHNGVSRDGQDNNSKPDAIAKALIKVLNAL